MCMRSHFSCIVLLNKVPRIAGDHRYQSGVRVTGKIIIDPTHHVTTEDCCTFTFNLRTEKRKKGFTFHSFQIVEVGTFRSDT